MTTAAEILAVSANANDADARAQAITDNIEQDWSNEATLYTFADGSVLVVSGPQVNAFADMTAARAELDPQIEVGDRVEAGQGDDHDIGRVESIDGDTAFVAWDSGVKTRANVSALSLADN